MDAGVDRLQELIVVVVAEPLHPGIRREVGIVVRVEHSAGVIAVVGAAPTEVVVKIAPKPFYLVHVAVYKKRIPPALFQIAIDYPGVGVRMGAVFGTMARTVYHNRAQGVDGVQYGLVRVIIYLRLRKTESLEQVYGFVCVGGTVRGAVIHSYLVSDVPKNVGDELLGGVGRRRHGAFPLSISVFPVPVAARPAAKFVPVDAVVRESVKPDRMLPVGHDLYGGQSHTADGSAAPGVVSV